MDSLNLVYRIRKSGIKCGVRHYRYVRIKGVEEDGELILANVTKDNKKEFAYIHGHGGATEVRLTFADGKNYEDRARCNMKDPFCKRLGIAVCVGRILKKRVGEGIVDAIK